MKALEPRNDFMRVPYGFINRKTFPQVNEEIFAEQTAVTPQMKVVD